MTCRSFWITLGVCFFMALSGSAQSGLTLTNFTYSSQKREVGKVVRADGKAISQPLKLFKESKKHFSICDGNTLVIKKKAASQAEVKWYDVVLQGAAGRPDTFRIVKDEFLKNEVIAHRGAWKNTKVPENSLAALQHAIQLGCAGSEFDAHLSADSVVFVNHDATFKGVSLEHSPAATLSQLQLNNGEPMPTLAAHLRMGQSQNKTKLVLELKPSAVNKARGLVLAKKAVELVREHRAQAWIIYISFDYDILLKILELEPYAQVAFLGGNKPPAELAKDRLYGSDYHFSFLKKLPEWIEESHRLGLTVNTWTIDNPEDMDWLLDRKVDFITTNQPEILLQKLTERKNKDK